MHNCQANIVLCFIFHLFFLRIDEDKYKIIVKSYYWSFMKNYSLLIIKLFLLSFNIDAQSDNFRFKKLLAEHPNEKVPFAVTNTTGTIDRLLADKEVTVKQITKNWIFLNASPAWIANAQTNKVIDQFHYEFNAGQQPLNDSTRVKH